MYTDRLGVVVCEVLNTYQTRTGFKSKKIKQWINFVLFILVYFSDFIFFFKQNAKYQQYKSDRRRPTCDSHRFSPSSRVIHIDSLHHKSRKPCGLKTVVCDDAMYYDHKQSPGNRVYIQMFFSNLGFPMQCSLPSIWKMLLSQTIKNETFPPITL